MKTLSLVRGNSEYKAYISPDGYGFYEYSLYEIIPKKHWWSSGKHYIGHGTVWDNIEKEISAHIAKEIRMENKINNLAEQFDKL